ncbi:LysR family transcriptional regulator [Spirillospora sp. NPDC052242]
MPRHERNPGGIPAAHRRQVARAHAAVPNPHRDVRPPQLPPLEHPPFEARPRSEGGPPVHLTHGTTPISKPGRTSPGQFALVVAQPPLSRAIHRLERRLGATLLERTSRSVALTEAGRVLLREARAALHAVDAAERRTRRADGALLHLPFDDSAGFDTEELGTEGQVVLLPAAHPLAARSHLRPDLAAVPVLDAPAVTTVIAWPRTAARRPSPASSGPPPASRTA